ncbi:hypothetical protein DPMN_194585 [Dreissena polymorpha]|uniref:Uncharacterized protein n=1 Tax=Dreissena polymorpha TaxID=45954 RepID=A0A9D4BEY3_DREPO|nr:hypothetical protein DPMN_194585 [Dreissena polymorpha]
MGSLKRGNLSNQGKNEEKKIVLKRNLEEMHIADEFRFQLGKKKRRQRRKQCFKKKWNKRKRN